MILLSANNKFANFLLIILSTIVAFAFIQLWFIYALLGPTQLLAVFSTVIWLGIGIFLWRFEKESFVILLPIYLGQTFAIISNVYLEGGAYIIEQSDYSHATGSTLRLTFYSTIFLIGTIIGYKSLKSNLISCSYSFCPPFKQKYPIIVALALVVLLFNVLNILLFGSPLQMGIQRFDYWRLHPVPILSKLTSYLFLLCFYLGAVYGGAKNYFYKISSILILIAYFVINILLGEKFTGFYLDVMYFLIGFLLSRLWLRGAIPKIFTILLTSVLLLIPLFYLVVWHYTNLHGIDTELVLKFIIARIFALQGHVWWGFDRLMMDGHSISQGLGSLFISEPDTNNSLIYNLMYQIAPSSLVDSYKERNVTFSMLSPAISVYLFGYTGTLLYQFIGGCIFGMSGAYLLCKLAKSQIISSFIALKIYLMLTHVFNMGVVSIFVQPTFYFYVIYAIVDITISRHNSIPSGDCSDHFILSSSVSSNS